jgi:N-formylglutamate amidohydrolase
MLTGRLLELDPAMFSDELPSFVNAGSPRVRLGLGTIARVVAGGEDIYIRKLRFAEAMRRIERLYHPYHRGCVGWLGRLSVYSAAIC